MPEAIESGNTDASIEDTPKWIATLVRGAHYDLRGEVFTAGFPKPCFDFQKVHLEEHAVHVIDTPGWSAEYDDDSTRATTVQMFEFKPNDGSADGALPLTAPASARMRSFDEAERMRHARNAERTAGLSDYTRGA